MTDRTWVVEVFDSEYDTDFIPDFLADDAGVQQMLQGAQANDADVHRGSESRPWICFHHRQAGTGEPLERAYMVAFAV